MDHFLLHSHLLVRLAECDLHVAQCEQNIFDQERRVSSRAAAGGDTCLNAALLGTFRELRLSHLRARDGLLRRIGNDGAIPGEA